MFDSTQCRATSKRRAPSDHHDKETQLPQSKRQKLSTSTRLQAQPSADHWDRLSQVVFCRRALKEFDRRVHEEQGQADLTASCVPDLPRGRLSTILKRFSRQGGPNLSHIRGFASIQTAMSTSSGQSRERSSTSGRTQLTRSSKTSPYSGQYEAGLNEANIMIHGLDYFPDKPPKPKNFTTIQQRMLLSRASLSPSRFTEDDFEDFVQSCTQARSETRVVQRVMPYISGKDGRFKTEADVEFNNIEPFNPSLAAAKPDLYDGVLTSKVRKQVRDDLGPWIIPSTNSTNPIAPNFFVEAKSDKGRADVAKKQACHDGAIGARAMLSLQNYGADEAVYDGNASSFSATYHDDQLKLYATHVTAPAAEGELPAYHMIQLDSFALTGNIRNCREGMRAFRNLRDVAEEFRDGHIKHTDGVASTMPVNTASSRRITQPSRHSSRAAVPEADSDPPVDEPAFSPAPSKRLRHERATPRS